MQAPGFRYSFTPLPGYFSPFPHGTHPLSVIRKYSGNQVVLADSHRIPRAPCYNGKTPHTHTTRFRLQGSHPLRPAIPDGSATQPHTRPTPAEMRTDAPQQPRRRSPCRVTTRQRFSHHPLSLATTHGISSPTGTKMFHFPASPPTPYTIQMQVTRHNSCRVPPFGNPRITARQPAPRGISQATTSFIGP